MTSNRDDPSQQTRYEVFYQRRESAGAASLELTNANAALAAATTDYDKVKALERVEHAIERKRQADLALAATSVRKLGQL